MVLISRKDMQAPSNSYFFNILYDIFLLEFCNWNTSCKGGNGKEVASL
jgi:hypothetical protein